MRYIRRRAPRRFLSTSRTTGALLVAVVALGARAATARAQSSRMSLGDLYREARQASPKVDAAHALARAAEARVPGAKRPPDPELQLGFMNYT
ncbi:MAG TPA: hypothetical protein VFT57_15490, partial [Gemmatimonadaceae bacterium]|nr:hypothetical protein [Gemmatimonadaceae bacterium]